MKLNLFVFNVQCINNKKQLLNAYVIDKEFDIILIQEHWLNINEVQALVFDNYRLATHFTRTNRIHGGVLTLTKKDLNMEVNILHNINNLSVELQCEIAAIHLKDINVTIINIYRSTDGNFNKFIEILTSVLDRLDHNKNIIFAGDFNVRFNMPDNENTYILCDLFNSYNLVKTVFFSTRGENCLDNVFINFDNNYCKTVKCVMPFSDHDAISSNFTFDAADKKDRLVTKSIRPFTLKGKLKFYQILSNTSWDFVKDISLGAENAFNMFLLILQAALDQSFPKKTVSNSSVGKITKKNKNRKWFNEKIVTMRNNLNVLHDYYLKHPTENNRKIRNQYRGQYRREINKAKIAVNSDYIRNSKNISKASWTIINENKAKNEPQICENSANEINNFFINVIDNLVRKLKDTDVNPLSFLTSSLPTPRKTFTFKQVTYIETRDAINSLKNSAARDAYGFNVPILKYVKDIIVIPLTNLINNCIASNIFPDQLKVASVVPVHKKGDKSDLNNYRPVSLLPILSKVFEKLLKNQIISFFESNNLFSDSQFGFRAGKSTTDALLNFVDFVTNCFENGEFCMATLNDLSRAFDLVSPDILLDKLKFYNFDDDSIDLIRSYLNNRKQFVALNGQTSEIKLLKYGVPQGSVLGPPLFLVFINDLPSTIKNVGITRLRTTEFADDFTVEIVSSSFDELTANQILINDVCKSWFLSNRLVQNETKTQNIVISLKNHVFKNPTSVKFLGTEITPNLNWSCYIDGLASKLAASAYCIKNLKNYVHIDVMRIAYFAFFQSHLLYAILVWGHSAHVSRIFRIQRRVIRSMAGIKTRDCCKKGFINLEILTLPSLYILNCLQYLHAHKEDYVTHSHFHSHNTRIKEQFKPETLRLTTSRYSLNFYMFKFYNILPQNVRDLPLTSFKTKIKTYLLSKAFYSFDEYSMNNFNDMSHQNS